MSLNLGCPQERFHWQRFLGLAVLEQERSQDATKLPEHKLDMCMETSKASVASSALSEEPGSLTSWAPTCRKIRDCT
jgi:hypothetical protein